MVPSTEPSGRTSIQVPTPRGAEPRLAVMVHSTPGSPAAGGAAAGPRRARSRTSSAAMDTAISAGVWAPMDRPMGLCTPSRIFRAMPAASRAAFTAATLVLLPIMPA